MISSMDEPQRLLGLIAQLLGYPDAEWRAQLDDAAREAEELSDAQAAHALQGFIEAARAAEPAKLEGDYVSAFDFNKKTSLYLTSRNRNDASQQRADLLVYSVYYKESGFEPDHELPDYLPALLELASAVDGAEARRILQGARTDMELLRDALAEAGLDGYRALVDEALHAADDVDEEVAA